MEDERNYAIAKYLGHTTDDQKGICYKSVGILFHNENQPKPMYQHGTYHRRVDQSVPYPISPFSLMCEPS